MQNFFRRPRGVAQIVRQVVEEFLNSHRRFRSAQLAQFRRRKAEIAHLSPSPITARSSTRTIPTISFGYVLAYNLAKMPPKECAAKTYVCRLKQGMKIGDEITCCARHRNGHAPAKMIRIKKNVPGRSYAQTR